MGDWYLKYHDKHWQNGVTVVLALALQKLLVLSLIVYLLFLPTLNQSMWAYVMYVTLDPNATPNITMHYSLHFVITGTIVCSK